MISFPKIMISFPKILQFGDLRIADQLKEGEVEITEKIDGSMFGFGLSPDGSLLHRSKGQDMTNDPSPPKLFRPAIDAVFERQQFIRENLRPGEWIFGETLTSPHHNTLSYAVVPKGYLQVFGYWNGQWAHGDELRHKAASLGYDSIPVLYKGKLPPLKQLEEFLELESCLGKEKIEGIVIRHLTAFWPGFWEPLPVMCKIVRADFKEKNQANWKSERASPSNKMDLILQQYRTEARWQKAVQHLTELGKIEGRMQDTPLLIEEVERDLLEECREEIKEELFKAIQKDLKRIIVSGLPVWYKRRLAQDFQDELLSETKKTIEDSYGIT